MFAGRNDTSHADLSNLTDAARQRPAGRSWWVRKTELDETGVFYCRIPDISDHTYKV